MHQSVADVSQRTAPYADGVHLHHVVGNGAESGHRSERLSLEVHVQSGYYDANIVVGKFVADIHKVVAEELRFVYANDVNVVTALVCLVIGLFVGIFYYIGLLLLLYAYFRMLSRNVHKRYAENIAFMQKTAGVRAKFGQLQQRFALRKTYRYFSCPHCRQQVRVPKGRGKISITCPKCGTQFIKKS